MKSADGIDGQLDPSLGRVREGAQRMAYHQTASTHPPREKVGMCQCNPFPYCMSLERGGGGESPRGKSRQFMVLVFEVGFWEEVLIPL